MIGDLLIGPYEQPPRFSGASYLHFLTEELPQTLGNVQWQRDKLCALYIMDLLLILPAT
jgi:hypothetical protein